MVNAQIRDYPRDKAPDYQVQGEGPLRVTISGLDGTGKLLFKQIDSLAESFRVVTFRLRDTRDFTYDDLTRDVAAIIGDLGEKRAIVLGESFGGTIALT